MKTLRVVTRLLFPLVLWLVCQQMRILLAKHLMLSNKKKFWKLVKLTWVTNLNVDNTAVATVTSPVEVSAHSRRKYSEFEWVIFQHNRRNTCVSADPATIPLPEDIPDRLDEIPLFHISKTEWKDFTCVMAVAHDESEDAVTKGPLKVNEWHQIILGLLIRLLYHSDLKAWLVFLFLLCLLLCILPSSYLSCSPLTICRWSWSREECLFFHCFIYMVYPVVISMTNVPVIFWRNLLFDLAPLWIKSLTVMLGLLMKF